MTQLGMSFLPLWGGQAPKITKAASLSATTAAILPVSSSALCALGMPWDHRLSIPKAGGPPSLRRVLLDGPTDCFDQRVLGKGLPQVADCTGSIHLLARCDIVKGRDEHHRDGYP